MTADESSCVFLDKNRDIVDFDGFKKHTQEFGLVRVKDGAVIRPSTQVFPGKMKTLAPINLDHYQAPPSPPVWGAGEVGFSSDWHKKHD